MSQPPQDDKQKHTKQPFVREQISVANDGCVRGIFVFIALCLIFGAILFVMSQL